MLPPMSTLTMPSQTLEVGQSAAIDVAVFGFDGVTPDTTSALQIFSGAAAPAQIDPSNNRRVIVQAVSPTTQSNVTIRRVGGTAHDLVQPIAVVAAPDRSKIELVAFTIL